MAIAEDRRRLTARLIVLRVSIAVAFGLLAFGFWFFQVVQHAQFREMAENNHQRTLPLRAPRGVIFDREGRVIVDNRNSFNISILREHSKDLERTITRLSEVTGVPADEIREIVARHRHEPSYRPIVVISDATLAQVAAVTARRLDFELPDVVVQEVPTRQYPSESLGAHLIVSFTDVVTSEGSACSIVGPAGPVEASTTTTGGGRTLVLSSSTFQPGTQYALICGEAQVTFTTRSDRPLAGAPALVAVNGSAPATPGTFRPILQTSTIQLAFSEPLDPRTIDGAIELLDDTGAVVPATTFAQGAGGTRPSSIRIRYSPSSVALP